MEAGKFATLLLILTLSAIVIYTRSAAEEKSPEKCATCHSDSLVFKEWQTSDHANSLKTLLKDPDADWTCLKCHSADYKHIRKLVRSTVWRSVSDMPTPKSANEHVSCSACHKQGSGIENDLIMPVGKLCNACHALHCGG